MADLREKATQLVSYGEYPALATRVSIPNVNLLSKKGSILYGTGNPATKDATIGEETYQYAEVKALIVESDKTGLFVLSNNKDGNLRYIPVINDYTDYGSELGILSASVAYDINKKLHIANAVARSGISMGDNATGFANNDIAIGDGANATSTSGSDNSAIAIGKKAQATDSNIAIGDGAVCDFISKTIQLGTGENRVRDSFQVWDTPMLVNGKIPLSSLSPTITVNNKTGLVLSNGQTGETMSYDGTVVLGPQAVTTETEGVAIGNQAIARGAGIAIGGGNVTANGSGVAIGAGAEAGTEGIAIGSTTFAGENSIAIGDLAEAADETIQLGRFESTFLFRVGNFTVMSKDGQIPSQRLTDALSSIYQRLDDLGFKEGVATYTKSGSGTAASVESDITVQTNSLQKMGKWCIFNFKVHMKGSRGVTRNIDITVPNDFRPKTDTIIKLGGADTTIKSTGVIDTITWKASNEVADEADFVYYNAWWELP